MSARKLPFTATIYCVPSKVKDANGKPYPGGYPGGLLEDIRWRLFQGRPAPILHVPGGWADNYNTRVGHAHNWGYGVNDKKADINPDTRPDFCFDCREIKKHFVASNDGTRHYYYEREVTLNKRGQLDQQADTSGPAFAAVILDPDYNRAFAEKHRENEDDRPTDEEIEQVGRDCFETVLGDDGLVIIFHHKDLGLGKGFVQIWNVTVYVSGRRQYPRVYTVWCKAFDKRAAYPAPCWQRKAE